MKQRERRHMNSLGDTGSLEIGYLTAQRCACLQQFLNRLVICCCLGDQRPVARGFDRNSWSQRGQTFLCEGVREKGIHKRS